jgi:competence protein ComEC
MPALAGWSAAFWATAQPAAPVTVVAAVSGVLGAALAGLLTRGRWRQRGHRSRAGATVAAAALTVAVVAGVLACTAYRLNERGAGPLPGWVRDRTVVELTGQVVSDPRPVAAGRFPGPSRVAVQLRAQGVGARGQHVSTSLPMLVLAPGGSGPGSWSLVAAGQQVRLRGRLTPSDRGDEPVALVTARGAPQRVTAGSWPWRVADRVRAGLRGACRGLSADSAGLLPSLVVGDTSSLPEGLRADLKAAGLTHLTAVSGANVAIFVGTVGWLAAAAGAARRTRWVVSAVAVAGFVVLARPSPSVLRAAAMAGVALVGLASARRPRGLPVLATAVVLLLGDNPWLARNPGFALSAVATGGLLLLARPWADRLARRMPRPLALALAAPAAAQAACGPVLVLLTPSVSLVSIPANLLAEPAVAPATLLGVAAAGLSLIWPQAAYLTAWSGSLATDWIALVAHRGAAVPLANLPWPGGLAGAGLLAVLTAALIWATARDRGRTPGASPGGNGVAQEEYLRASSRRGRGRGGRVVAVLAVAVCAGWVLLPGADRLLPWPGRGVPDGWLMMMCDVGQGDAVAVRSGPDRAILLDAGPQPAAIDACLRRLGVRHLDLVVITHLHADHAFGLPGVLHGRDVGEIWVSPLAEPAGNAEAVRRWVGAAGARQVQAWAGAQGARGRGGWMVRWRVLEPRDPPSASGDVTAVDGTAVNESSVAVMIDAEGPAGQVRLLDLGDLETGRQQGLAERLRKGGDTIGGTVDLVKVAHHGSSRQSEALYAACGAQVALIGVGAGNDYGHPSPTALTMLASIGFRVLRTDLDGDLAVERSPEGIRVTGLG